MLCWRRFLALKSKVSDALRQEVAGALMPEWESARDVWDGLKRWSVRSVRNALQHMVDAGEAEMRRVPFWNGGTVNMYRKKV